MIEKFIEKFAADTEVLNPCANSPVILSDDSVYLVNKGAVNIFAVDSGEGYSAGSRKQIVNLRENKLFTGFISGRTNLSQELIAVGKPETEIYRISRNLFTEIMAGEAGSIGVFLLDEWINALLYNVFEPLRALDYEEISSGKAFEFDSGTQVMSKNMLMWTEIIKGDAEVSGSKECIIKEGDVFPVSDVIYIRLGSPGVLSGATTPEVLAKGSLWKNTDELFLLLINEIDRSRKEFYENEQKRLDKREELKQVSLKKGVSRLINILKTDSGRDMDEFGINEDPVLSACKIIGKYLNLSFVLPGHSEGNPDVKERLEEIARASRIKVRKTLLEVNWWKSDNGSLLAFKKEDGNPVALIPKSPGKYIFTDVCSGERGIVDIDESDKFEEFAYYFYRPFPEKPISWWGLVRFGTFRNSRDMIMVVLVGIAGALLGLVNPYLMGVLFDSVIPSASMSELNQMVYLLISAAISISLFELTRSIAILRFEGKMDRDIQAALWDRLLALPVPFFKQYSAGDLASRSLGIGNIRRILSGVTLNSILSGIFSFFYCLQLFYYNVKLAFIGFGLGILIMIIAMFIGYIYVKFQMPLLEIEGKISGMVLQFINGISKLRITGMEDFAFQFWANKFGEKKKMAFKAGIAQCTLRTFMSIFPVFSSMLIFGFIVSFLEGPVFSVGDFAAYFSAFGQYQNALLQMGLYITSSLTMIPIYKRLKPIIQAVPEVDESKVKPDELKGNINIYNLCFRYSEDGPQIIKDLTLEVKSGEFIAIAGQSGSGKSTMVRLLLGFETPESGSIFYDDQDMITVDVGGIRKQIGVVLQNSAIMQGSVFENIVGSANLTLDDAWKAAEMVGIDEDIRSMPMQMQTVLTFGGGTLSGGQRQRILIARALVRKPRIILFDEATSALDNRTQKTVSDSLEKLNVTRVVIAHRLSTIKNADRICFLDKGKIVEQGSYSELMALNGQFATLARRQII